jgi:hypothetical protein
MGPIVTDQICKGGATIGSMDLLSTLWCVSSFAPCKWVASIYGSCEKACEEGGLQRRRTQRGAWAELVLIAGHHKQGLECEIQTPKEVQRQKAGLELLVPLLERLRQ